VSVPSNLSYRDKTDPHAIKYKIHKDSHAAITLPTSWLPLAWLTKNVQSCNTLAYQPNFDLLISGSVHANGQPERLTQRDKLTDAPDDHTHATAMTSIGNLERDLRKMDLIWI